MPDFGLYTALRGQSDWNAKRHDAMVNINIAQEREKRAKESMHEQMQIDEGMQQAFDAMANLDVLPEDADRIKAVEKKNRAIVEAGVAKHNGDLKRYLALGGQKDMHTYKNAVLQSEEVKNAVTNKINLQNYVQDRGKNSFIKSVMVDMPVTGPDGKQVAQPTRMSMEQQLKLFQDGKINKLTYGGAEPKVNLGIEDFSRIYKNPLDPYHPDNYVSESDIYKKALSKGASEEHARDLSQRYGTMTKQGGDAWRWNAKDVSQLKLAYDQLNMKRQAMSMKASGGKGGSGAAQVLNIIGTRAETLQPGQQMPISSTEKELWQKTLDFMPLKEGESKMGGKYKWTGDAMGPDFKTKVPMGTGEIRQINGIVKGSDGKMYLDATAAFDDDDPAIMEGMMWDAPKKGLERNFVDEPGSDGAGWNWFGMGSTFVGNVMIPVENYIRDEHTRTILNKEINAKTNQTNLPTDYDDQAEMMKAIQTMGTFGDLEENYGYPLEELIGDE